MSRPAPNIPAPMTGAVQTEVATLSDVPTAKDLSIWLAERGLDTSKWGSGDTKDVSKFWKEMQGEEAGLESWKKADGAMQVVRVVHVLRAKVCSQDSYNRGVFLFNTWQQFGDGRKRTRNGLLSEKLTVKEMPLEEHLLEVCERAVTEEEMQRLTEAAFRLAPGVPVPSYDPNYKCPLKVRDAYFVDHTVEFEESKSYPGLLTMYHLYTVDIICEGLPSVDFNTLEYDHATDGKPPKLKYVHAWVWLEWSQVQRYLFEGSSLKERMSRDSFKSPEHLRSWLEPYDLDLDKWGTGVYRSVDNLWTELQKEQTQLELWGRQDGVPLLMRVVHLLQLQVVSSDARQSRKFLLHMWQQSKEGIVRNINRLMAKKLSVADLPINEEKLVAAAWEAVREQLTCIVDAHFRMGAGVEPPTHDSVKPQKVVVKAVEYRDHNYDIEESTTFKGMQTMYHIYTCEVECEGLPMADFTSVDFSRAGGPHANGWHWVTWPETTNLLHARAAGVERTLDIHQRRLGKLIDRKCKALSASLERMQTKLGKEGADLNSASSVLTDIEKDLRTLKDANPSAVEKALPPSMVSKMAESTILSEDLMQHVPTTVTGLQGEPMDEHRMYQNGTEASNSMMDGKRFQSTWFCCAPVAFEESITT